MSVSSHLSPEPERRLWIIHENVRRSVEWTDTKLGILAVLAVLEIPVIFGGFRPGMLAYAGALLICLALPLALTGLSPFTETPKPVPLLDQPVGKMLPDDSFLLPRDLARYTHADLVFRLEKYLGGGITALRYHEDIVGRIIAASRVCVRKGRLFSAACAAALTAQLALVAAMLMR